MSVLYVAMRLETWDNALEMDGPLAIPVRVKTNLAGYLPVYESLDDLGADYPDADIAVIERTKSE